MPKAIQPVTLSENEQTELRMIANHGTHSARTIKRAQILLPVMLADTPMIQVIQDDLNTHTYGSFYEHLSAPARPSAQAPTAVPLYPKHGSWLNMAEIELSVLVRQCLDRRIPSLQALEHEALAWQEERRSSGHSD